VPAEDRSAAQNQATTTTTEATMDELSELALPDLAGEVIASVSTEIVREGEGERLVVEFKSGRLIHITSYPSGSGSGLIVIEATP